MPSVKCHNCRRGIDFTDGEIGSTVNCVCGAQVLLTASVAKRSLWPLVFMGFCAAGIVAGISVWLFAWAPHSPPPIVSTLTSAPSAVTLSAQGSTPNAPPGWEVVPATLSSEEIYRKISPMVVTIETFDEKRHPLGLGSGVILSADGWIATNLHVINGENTFSASVRTSHGSTFEATGFREVTDSGMFDMDDQIKKAFDAAHIPIHDVNDVALIKVNGHDLPFAALDGNMPPIGSRVYAIGAPEGLDNTLSDGLVSAIRQVSSITLIQTTAPFSHGSSGVPLLSDKGEVIGLTSYISKEGQNLNFAVPAKVVFDLLHENEHVLRRVKTVTVDVETFTVDVKTTKKEVELAKDVEVRLEHAGIKVVNDRAVADAYLSVTYIAGGETDPDGKMIYRIPTTCFNPTFKTNIWLFSRYGTSDQFQSMTMEVIDQLINDWMNANK